MFNNVVNDSALFLTLLSKFIVFIEIKIAYVVTYLCICVWKRVQVRARERERQREDFFLSPDIASYRNKFLSFKV